MNVELSPSMMCANQGHLEEEIKLLLKAKIDSFHLDLMDGNYVPNFGLNLDTIKYIKENCNIPCEVHMMMKCPEKYIDKLASMHIDTIYIHPDSTFQYVSVLQKIQSLDINSGLVISPGMNYKAYEESFAYVNKLLVMSVNPGFSGQKYIEAINSKLFELCKKKEQYQIKVILDGACSIDRIKAYSEKGVDGFVLGTAALFNKQENYQEIINKIRGCIK